MNLAELELLAICPEAALVLACIAGPACTKPPSGGAPSAQSGDASPFASPAIAVKTHDCASVERDYDAVVEAPSATSCAADGDCGCYQGGVSKRHGCGGIANKTAIRTAQTLAAEMSAASCGGGISCAAWTCSPRCESGLCVNSR